MEGDTCVCVCVCIHLRGGREGEGEIRKEEGGERERC